jgi:predicted DsbA family dithiol-disulfide isomerase
MDRVTNTSPSAPARAITVFGDICCPFTYAGLESLRRERDQRCSPLRIEVRAWPLEWINRKPFDPDHVAAEVRALRSGPAGDLFAGFEPRSFPTTSIPAFGLVHRAYTFGAGFGEQAAFVVRHAIFEGGLDVGDTRVLAEIGASLGIDPSPIDDAQRWVAEDLEAGRGLGVVGSPHFVTERGSWFCPLLHITKDGGEFVVTIDSQTRGEFLDAVFA